MDTPEKNGSYLPIAALILALIATALGIYSALGVSKAKRQLSGVSSLSDRMDSIEASAQKASKDAQSAMSQNDQMASQVQNNFNQISNEFGDIRTSINRLTIDNKTLSDKVAGFGSHPVATHSSSTSSAKASEKPAATAVAPGTNGLHADGTYTIKSGDFFSKIARKFGVSVEAIQNANPGVNPRKLRVGQKIVIPVKKPAGGNGGS